MSNSFYYHMLHFIKNEKVTADSIYQTVSTIICYISSKMKKVTADIICQTVSAIICYISSKMKKVTAVVVGEMTVQLHVGCRFSGALLLLLHCPLPLSTAVTATTIFSRKSNTCRIIIGK